MAKLLSEKTAIIYGGCGLGGGGQVLR